MRSANLAYAVVRPGEWAVVTDLRQGLALAYEERAQLWAMPARVWRQVPAREAGVLEKYAWLVFEPGRPSTRPTAQDAMDQVRRMKRQGWNEHEYHELACELVRVAE